MATNHGSLSIITTRTSASLNLNSETSLAVVGTVAGAAVLASIVQGCKEQPLHIDQPIVSDKVQ